MTYLWLINFALLAYIIASDESIAKAFYYTINLGKSYIQRQLWWLKNNPRTPWAKYSMWRRSNRLAKELMDEFKNKKNTDL